MFKNASLQSFLLCDNVQNIPTPEGLKTNIMGVLDAIRLPCVPCLYSFFVVASVKYEKNDTAETTIRIVLRDPGEEIVFDTEKVTVPSDPSAHEVLGPTIFNFNMDARNVYIKEVGSYEILIYLNDEEIGKISFSVELAEGVV